MDDNLTRYNYEKVWAETSPVDKGRHALPFPIAKHAMALPLA